MQVIFEVMETLKVRFDTFDMSRKILSDRVEIEVRTANYLSENL